MTKKKVVSDSIEPTNDINETMKEDILFTGIVTDCFKLNIRKEPDKNAMIVATVNILTKLKVNKEKSTNEWYYVIDEDGNSGYCVKQYIALEC